MDRFIESEKELLSESFKDYKAKLAQLYPPVSKIWRLFGRSDHVPIEGINKTKAQEIQDSFDLKDARANIFICWCLVWAATYIN